MKSLNRLRFLYLVIIAASMFCCNPEEIILPGKVTGIVTDAETNQALQNASVTLLALNYSIITGTDGKFQFKNVTPGKYEIEATIPTFSSNKKSIVVEPANAAEINFTLTKSPHPGISNTFLDFGFNSELTFTISNTGSGKLFYLFYPPLSWIQVVPSTGEVTTETDTIKVIIDRNGLSLNLIKEKIRVFSFTGDNLINDSIIVYLNGVYDRYINKHYKIIIIGNQTWMTENLIATNFNDGSAIPLVLNPMDWSTLTSPGYTWYLNNQLSFKYPYGALYNGYTVQTGKVCPSGWHVPTISDLEILRDFLGGYGEAGGKMKETGT